MSYYRRANQSGGTYFFTVVTYRRQPFLCDDDVRMALRDAIERVRNRYDFQIDAWVLLPGVIVLFVQNHTVDKLLSLHINML